MVPNWSKIILDSDFQRFLKETGRAFLFENLGGLTGLYHLGYFGMFSGITLCMAKGSKVKKGKTFKDNLQ